MYLDDLSLTLNPETDWFASCRGSDLEVIGPMLGLFLRKKARGFCQALFAKWSGTENMSDIDIDLDVCEKAIAPFVVELSISERSAKLFENTVHVSCDDLTYVKNESEGTEKLSTTITVHEIREDYHGWAWSCLQGGDFVPLRDLTLPDSCESGSELLLPDTAMVSVAKSRSGRIVKQPKMFENFKMLF